MTVHEASSFAEAIARAYAIAKPAGVVLLAPACSSFDMFHDYAERGRGSRRKSRESRNASE